LFGDICSLDASSPGAAAGAAPNRPFNALPPIHPAPIPIMAIKAVSIIFEALFGFGVGEGTTYSSLIITGLPSIVRAKRKLDALAIGVPPSEKFDQDPEWQYTCRRDRTGNA
jgi:hypothetical protein